MADEHHNDDSWDRYWEHGFLTSCSGAFDANYEGAIEEAWRRMLATVPAGGRVLDICTGNGAVALIASEVSRSKGLDLEIHGIDSAAIRPLETVTTGRHLLEGIRFHPRTPAEATPFPDGHFQAITGQYAFEYTDQERCVAEMARIAAPDCRLMFIIHHADSVVMQTTRAELSNAAIIFEETQIFERAREIIEIVGRARSAAERQALAADQDAEAARLALNTAAGRVAAALETSPHPELLQITLNRVAEAYRSLGTEGREQALERLADSRSEVSANVGRLRDLVAAARDATDMSHICDSLAKSGFSPSEPIAIRHDQDRLMGWQITARRHHA